MDQSEDLLSILTLQLRPNTSAGPAGVEAVLLRPQPCVRIRRLIMSVTLILLKTDDPEMKTVNGWC